VPIQVISDNFLNSHCRRGVATKDNSTGLQSSQTFSDSDTITVQKYLPKCHFALFTGVPLDGLSLPPPEFDPTTRSRRAADRTAYCPHHLVSSSISVANNQEFWKVAKRTMNA